MRETNPSSVSSMISFRKADRSPILFRLASPCSTSSTHWNEQEQELMHGTIAMALQTR